MNKQETIMSKLSELISDLAGTLTVKNLGGTILITGSVITHDPEAKAKIASTIEEFYPNSLFINSVEILTGLSVVDNGEVSSTIETEDLLDELSIVYMGNLPINAITPSPKFKLVNKENFVKVDDCIKVLDFIAPIVLDSNLTIIDGNLRYEMAKANGKLRVPVVILDAADKRTEFLRMVLNRSSEFQRWVYSDIDDFVDTNPQVQPLAEPLGFFGKLLLPTSFFANTVVNYRIDEYNDQQKLYRQELGIAEWAKVMRERNAKAEAAKEMRTEKKKSAVSLFDLVPKPEDFIATHDIKEELAEHTEMMRGVARTITDNYDEERKAKLVKEGKWQGSRRTTKEKAADKRNSVLNEDTDNYLDETEQLSEVIEGSIVEEVEVKPTPEVKPKPTKENATKAKAQPAESTPPKKLTLAEQFALQQAALSGSVQDIHDEDELTEETKEVNLDDLF